jgi:mersacidin/lichenicidin family type 2 lantibiotic
MSRHVDIARAWKDEEYRRSLSDAERAQLPSNPAGFAELTDAALGSIQGGWCPSTIDEFYCNGSTAGMYCSTATMGC